MKSTMKRLASAGKLRSRKHHEERAEEGGRTAAVGAQDVRVEHATYHTMVRRRVYRRRE